MFIDFLVENVHFRMQITSLTIHYITQSVILYFTRPTKQISHEPKGHYLIGSKWSFNIKVIKHSDVKTKEPTL